jgi:hypothetical protein
MAKWKYSEVEMIGALTQMDARRSAAEVGRQVGSEQAHRLRLEGQVRGDERGRGAAARRLEDENQQLKKLVADPSPDKDMLTSGGRKCSGCGNIFR